MPDRLIRAIVNLSSGSGPAALEAMEKVGGFAVEPADAASLGDRLRRAVADGAERLVVAGGDGTVASAAAVVTAVAATAPVARTVRRGRA